MGFQNVRIENMSYRQSAYAATQNKLVVTAQTGVFLAVLLAVQVVGLPNLVTGSMVNAIFVFTLHFLGVRSALFLAFLSPFGGILSGHLPAPMYPLLPVIVCGNFVLVWACRVSAGSGLLLRVVVPAALKGVIIGMAGFTVIRVLSLTEQVRWLVLPVLGIQFFTALVGIVAGEKLFQAIVKGRTPF